MATRVPKNKQSRKQRAALGKMAGGANAKLLGRAGGRMRARAKSGGKGGSWG